MSALYTAVTFPTRVSSTFTQWRSQEFEGWVKADQGISETQVPGRVNGQIEPMAGFGAKQFLFVSLTISGKICTFADLNNKQ